MEMNTMPSFSKNTICRICMQIDTNLFPIFNEIFTGDNNTITVAKILSEFTKYPVTYNDQLPAQVCYKCMTLARTAYQFIKQTEEAYCCLKALYDKTWVPKRQVSGMCANTTNTYTQTEESTVFQCKICLINFFAVSELSQHRFAIHSNDGKKCHICEKTFNKLRQLKSHISKEHPSEGIPCDFKCNICSKEFRRKNNLERHLVVIHNSKDNTLNINSVSMDEPEIETVIPPCFNENSSHRQDYQDVGDNETPANDTTEATNPLSDEDERFEHHSFNTMEKVENVKQFVNVVVSELRQHRSVIHCNEDKKCRVCGKTFNKFRQLKAHFSTDHPSEEIRCDFKCNICAKEFKRKTNLERHLLVMHSSKDNTLNINSEPETVIPPSFNENSSHCQDYQHDGDNETPANESTESTNPLSNEYVGLEDRDCQDDDDCETPVNETMSVTNTLSNEDDGLDHLCFNTMEKEQNVKQFVENITLPEISIKAEPMELVDISDDMNEPNINKYQITNTIILEEDDDFNDDGMHESNVKTKTVIPEEDDGVNDDDIHEPNVKKNTINPEVDVNDDHMNELNVIPEEDYDVSDDDMHEPMNEPNVKTKAIIPEVDDNDDVMHEPNVKKKALILKADDHMNKPNAKTKTAIPEEDNDYDVPEPNVKTKTVIPEEDENGDYNDKGKDEDKNYNRKIFKNKYPRNPDTNKYQCIECPLEFKLLGNLKRHISRHTNKSPFICRICCIPFTHKNSLQKHLRNIHVKKQLVCENNDINNKYRRDPDTNMYQCVECSMAFKSLGNVKRHMVKHTDNGQFMCHICSMLFKYKYNLKRHLRRIHAKKEFASNKDVDNDGKDAPSIKTKTIIPENDKDVDDNDNDKKNGEVENMCRLNNKDYDRKSFKNKYQINPNTNMYQCVECLMEFKSLGNAKRHMIKHTDDRPFMCHLCSMLFKYKNNLKRHLLRIHVKKKLSCENEDYDRKSFKNKYQRNPYTNMYQCTECQMEFISLDKIKNHMISHTDDRPFMCHICSILFKYKCNLKKHLREIHVKKQLDCGNKAKRKRFKKKYQRNPHTNMYQCIECLIEFKLLRNFKRHMLSHTNDKLFMCDICSISFKYKNNLLKHLHRIHANNKFPSDKGVDDESNIKEKTVTLEEDKEVDDNDKGMSKLNNKDYDHRSIKNKYQRNPDTNMYQCAECLTEFKLLGSVKRHMLTHTDYRPFLCNLCSVSFTRNDNLVKHLRRFHAKKE